MAGIGFALKRMFKKEYFSSRGLAYLYSAFVAAGPWILSVIIINSLIIAMEIIGVNQNERNLFSATIVYSFLFSQIIVAPFQLIATRYLSDKLYLKKYDFVRPTFIGLNKIIFFISLLFCFFFYVGKPLPLHYKIMSSNLFLLISMIWVIMIFLSAIKNYLLIAKAYFLGIVITIGTMILLVENPIPFKEFSTSSNFLLSYLIGLSIIFIIFLYSILSTFHTGNKFRYDFLRYFNKYSNLAIIGFLYTFGMWIDNIILWFGELEFKLFNTYIYAPFYDNAIFLSYLTIIPTMVLFLVFIETDFYMDYKAYFGNANSKVDYNTIDLSYKKMKKSLVFNLFYTFSIQFLITLTCVCLSKPIFQFLKLNYLVRNIFRITAIGACFNVYFFIIILILLYFEKRGSAAFLAISFFVLNFSLTLYFRKFSIEYTGFGFTISSIVTFILSLILLVLYIRKANYSTFALQPIYIEKNRGIFVNLANKLNRFTTNI